jgi:hypothetical protein
MTLVGAPVVLRRAMLVAAFVAYAVPAGARIGVDGPNGFRISMDASFQPDGEALPNGVTGGAPERLHRFVLDRGRRRYFAYDLVMTASGPDKLRIRIEPLSLSAAEVAKFTFVDSTLVLVPIPRLPLDREITAGDSLEIELLPAPAPAVGPRSIVDRLVFTRPANGAGSSSVFLDSAVSN